MVGKTRIKKYAWPILIGFIVFSGFFAYQLKNTRFDYDFEKFFPLHDEDTKFFFDHRAKFESDNDYLLVAIQNKEGIFDIPFLKKVDRFTQKLSDLKYVTSVTGITKHQNIFLLPNGLSVSKPYIDFQQIDLKRDSIAIYSSEELVNTLVSKDAKSLCIVVKHEEFLAKKKSDELIASLDQLIENHHFDHVVRAGRTVGQSYYITKMSKEMLFYVAMSAILIVVFLLIAFRSIWGVLLPQVILLGTMVWLVGFMNLVNQPINIILTTLPTVMFVVAMSDVIHLTSRYLDALRTNIGSIEAIKISLKEVGFSTFLTSLTTAIGFFSLYFVNVDPIRIYGVVLGFGVMLAFVLTIIMLPILFYFFPGPVTLVKKNKDGFWTKLLHRWFILILKKRKVVLIATSLLLILAGVGVAKIRANNFLMDDMRASDPVKQDFNFIDKNFGGIRPFEMAVTLKDSTRSLWDPEVIQELDIVENYLEKTYKAEINLSLAQTVKVMNRASHAGLKSYYEVPDSKRTIKGFKRKLRFVNEGKLLKVIIDSTEMTTRISGGMGDVGNDVISKRNKALDRFLASKPSKSYLDFKLTGTSHLIDKNMSYLAQSLIYGLLLSIVIIALIMGLLFRSWRMMILSIIPNVLPLIFVAAIMGFFGINIKTSTAIIFTIAFGIAVDDTIHYLGKFKHELKKGRSKIYALKRAYLVTGKAMILTTLILCSGFLLLMFSSFLGTFYMGLLLSLTLFFALLFDMILLPILILLFYHPKQK